MEQIESLRYRSYLKVGLVHGGPTGRVGDALDKTPNCYIYGVHYHGELISTIRFHHVTKEHPHSPSMKMFPDILEPRLAAGDTFIDASRFAIDPEFMTGGVIFPNATMRLVFLACQFFKASHCITMIQEHHEAFYKRVFNAHPIGEPRVYDTSIDCVVPLWEGDFKAVEEEVLERLPFFRSTESERRMLFKDISDPQRQPLSIVPTARFTLPALFMLLQLQEASWALPLGMP